MSQNIIKNDGSIGLTGSGVELDKYLDRLDKVNRRKVLKFIQKATTRIRDFHKKVDSEQFYLEVIRDYYLNQVNKNFSELDKYPKSLMINYIRTIARYNFVPSTKSQLRLIFAKKSKWNLYEKNKEDKDKGNSKEEVKDKPLEIYW